MSKAKLYQKLARASANFSRILKDSDNPFYKSKYADLNSIIEAVNPALSAEGLLLLQPVEKDQVTTMVIDTETGESISSSVALPTSITDPQKIGAAITYFRRFTLQSLLSLQALDDDGNSLSDNASKTKQTYTPKSTPKVETAPETKTNAPDPGAFKRTLGKPAAKPVSNGAAKSDWDM